MRSILIFLIKSTDQRTKSFDISTVIKYTSSHARDQLILYTQKTGLTALYIENVIHCGHNSVDDSNQVLIPINKCHLQNLLYIFTPASSKPSFPISLSHRQSQSITKNSKLNSSSHSLLYML